MGQRHPMLTCMLQCCAQCYVASSLSTQTFCKFYRGCWQRETYLKGDSGGQMHMDKECPFSSVTDYGRVWMKGARQQALECFGITTSLGGRCIWIRSAPSAVSLITAEFGWRVWMKQALECFSITTSLHWLRQSLDEEFGWSKPWSVLALLPLWGADAYG